MAAKVTDLRSALKMLEDMPGQLIETDVEVEPMAELSGVYRHVGAGGTVMRPTKEGPAMIFNNVKDIREQELRSACLRAEQESVHCWNVIRKISERNYITAWITRSRRC